MEHPTYERQLIAICACWELCAQYSAQVRAIAIANSLGGDYGTQEQHKRAQQLLYAQHVEAYARAKLQAAIADSLDATDTAAEYEAHWRDFWGDAITEQIAGEYVTAFAAAAQGITERRRAAREQTLALVAAESAPPTAESAAVAEASHAAWIESLRPGEIASGGGVP